MNAIPGTAPDLRRLDRVCRKLRIETERAACTDGNDQYFLKSVREGKIKLGITQMPPWQTILSQEEIWAIRSDIEALGNQCCERASASIATLALSL